MKTAKRIARITNAFAIAVSLVAGVSLPLGFFAITYRYTLGSLEAQAELSAQTLAGLVTANPGMWRFETARIEELLARQPLKRRADTLRVFDWEGALVAERRTDLPWPVLRISQGLYYGGDKVGHIEISHSLLPALERSALLGLLGILVGYLMFRLLPFKGVILAGESLQDANDFLRHVMEGSSNGIVVLDRAGSIQMINGQGAALSGYPTEALLGKPFTGLFAGPAQAQVQSHLQVAAHASRTVQFETGLTRADGGVVTVQCGARPLMMHGQGSGVVISLEDVTQRNLAEENRHRVDKLESVGLLAGGIAHDFNNLLTGILGSISCAKMAVQPEDKVFRYLANAEKGALRAADLTQQLLTFARGGAPVKKRKALGRLIQEASHFAVLGSGVRCACQVPENLWPCEVDEGQINQVLNNLILNAVQAMPGGGVVTVTCANRMFEGGSQGNRPPGAFVEIAIQDEGPGIPKELLPKIFNPYFTTKKAGTGLGLATAYSIIQKHGGTLTVASEGPGATFTLLLPALAGEGAEEPPAGRPIVRGSGKILVMDDEPLVLASAVAMLEALGFDCVTARDGGDAVALYRQAAAGRTPFTAVIMDLTVPGGMGGKEALAALLEQDPAVKGIVSSGYSDNAVMSDYAAFGFKGVLSKPYRIEDLSSALAQVVAAPSAHEPGVD